MIRAEKHLNILYLAMFAVVIGIISGFGAIVFRGMIGIIHNLTFSGKLSVFFDANVHTLKSVWGVGIIFVPVFGALIVSWITNTFAPEARGHGVPEVLDAIYHREGRIRPIVAVVKSIASSISIGTGGSVGREGPIIQIGSAFGSLMGQVINIAARQRIVLIAAGAAAAISATFNTPIGAMAFAIELLLISVSAVNVTIIAIATVTATVISHYFLGNSPSFYVPGLENAFSQAIKPNSIMAFVPFGILAGIAAAIFTQSIYWFEDQSAKLIRNPYWRHMTGMFLIGIMLYLMMRFSGHYYVEGVGYATIIDILNTTLSNPWFLLTLFMLKMLATGLTLGTGASGGIFSPSLFLGACLGATYGGFMNYLFPGLHIPEPVFAIAGMAAMVGGTTGAVLTAITMTFEQTRNYNSILPIVLTVALAYFVRTKISTQSIYTLKLYRRGVTIPQGLQAAIHGIKRASEIMSRDFVLITPDEINSWIQQQSGESSLSYGIVRENNEVLGVIRPELNYLISDIDPNQLIGKKFIFITEKTPWQTVTEKMNAQKANAVIVMKKHRDKTPDNIVGLITRHEIFKASEQFSHLMTSTHAPEN